MKKLAAKFLKSAVGEDRLEYDIEDLRTAYDLTVAQASELQLELHTQAGLAAHYRPF